MKQIWPVSIDAGNALLKGVRGSAPPVVLPNLVAADNNKLFGDLSFFGVREQPPLVVELDKRRWAVGEDALLASRHTRQNTGYARYDSSDFPAVIAALLGELYPAKGGTLALTFSLPVDGFGQAAAQVERLAGKWQFRHRGRSLSFDVPAGLMLPMPEAFGSLCYFLLNDQGGIVDVELAEGRVAIVDVGGFTTDILTFRELELDNVHGSIEQGVIQVRKAVNEAIKRQFNRGDLDRRDLETVIVDGVYKHRGKEHDVSEIVDSAVWELAQGVMQFYLDPNGLDGGLDYDAVIFTGGGSPAIRPHLESAMHDQGVLHHSILRVPDADSALANAIGAFRFTTLRRGL